MVSDCGISLSHYYSEPPGAARSTTTLEDHPLPSAWPSSTRCRFPPEKNFLSVPRMASFPAPFRSQHFTPTLKTDGITLLLKQFSVSTMLQG